MDAEPPAGGPQTSPAPKPPRRLMRWSLRGGLLLIVAAAILLSVWRSTRMETTASGLNYRDDVVGTGPQPNAGQTCVVHYTGWLWRNGRKGKKFDSSVDRKQPFQFRLGAGQVIPGWDEGVATMHVGGKRTLRIPSPLAYGKAGAGGMIPPNATLLFEVELLGLK